MNILSYNRFFVNPIKNFFDEFSFVYMGFKISVYNVYNYMKSIGEYPMNSYTEQEEKSLLAVKRYRLISIVAVVVALLLRTLSLLFFYEADIGYYRAGAVLPTILYIFFVLAAIGFGVLAFMQDKTCVPVPSPNAATKITAFAVGAVFGVTALLRYCLSATAMTRSTIFAFVAGGLAAIYFILLACKKLSPTLAILSGFGAILWFGCILLDSYFDVTVAMNATEKLAVHLAAASGMLLMLAEMRLACGAMKKRFYLFSLSLGTLGLCVASLPTLIADAAGVLGSRKLAFADFAFLALGLFGLVRLLSAFSVGKEENNVENIPETADETAEESKSETAAPPETTNETPMASEKRRSL